MWVAHRLSATTFPGQPCGYLGSVTEHANDDKPADHDRKLPDDITDETVEAVGSVSEALEWVERARGHLYSFHQLMGHADLTLGDACDKLRDAGHTEVADRLEAEMVGRNVLNGRWTFQIVEDFDDNYWSVLRDHEKRVRDELQQGHRHVFEARMKEDRRSHGRAGHEGTP
ncbi:hypothetical protein ACFQWH_24015 [Mycolicibacterium sp. GCM10028919]|jgi:hypothetical protein|uniref:hypothetical protein n=1 Tax=Mycolicibacterium sp. GCM10028919 TaxID=3273401 RepID=UPI0036171B07